MYVIYYNTRYDRDLLGGRNTRHSNDAIHSMSGGGADYVENEESSSYYQYIFYTLYRPTSITHILYHFSVVLSTECPRHLGLTKNGT
jgi:hypothetical protein